MLYQALLALHSLLRWVVLLAAIVAVVRALIGATGRRGWTRLDNQLSLLLVISIDTQTLLGLILYVALSPITTAAFSNFGAAMSDQVTRFWSVEHVVVMLVALALVHIGRTRTKKSGSPQAKHRAALIFFGLALVLILLAIPWPFLAYGRRLLPF